MSHIYIHFPFCVRKCLYCDFFSLPCENKPIPHEEYAKAILQEIELLGAGLSYQPPVKTIYVGGGTPSLMRPNDLQNILDALRDKLNFDSNIEFTLEANPGTLDREKMRAFRAAGVNRLSIGVQALNNKYLKRFGRIHTAREALQIIADAQHTGFERLNCDLIYGFPEQTLPEWRDDMSRIIDQGISHISCYALTAEKKTPYGKAIQKGDVRPVHPDFLAHLQEFTYNFLESANLIPYEISNFAQPGQESQHNLGYWHYDDFHGLGAGAVSQGDRGEGLGFRDQEEKIVRKTNFKFLEKYMTAVTNSEKYFEEEQIDQKTAQFEFIMMGLRLKEGITHERFHKKFHLNLLEVYPTAVDSAVKQGLLQKNDLGIQPTREGFLLNNTLISLFL